MGVGDRFGMEGAAQIAAAKYMLERGVEITLVWNKSKREHTIIGTRPPEARAAADAAARETGWGLPYFVDADHIGPGTVGDFIDCCDFFTLDVAEAIGKEASRDEALAFAGRHPELACELDLGGAAGRISLSRDDVAAIAAKFLPAAREAGALYRSIAARKGEDGFIAEVSMDETPTAQGPGELFVILAALAEEGVDLSTIAPKFTGRFNKGVDYVGDLQGFAREFEADVAVLAIAARRFGLRDELKLSVHSGSDKFSLYPIISRIIAERGAGIHLKTAGTTWLEELVGLAEGGGEGLEIAKEIYAKALPRFDELVAPYAQVVDIDKARLPAVAELSAWGASDYARALRHEPSEPRFNPHLRQFLHVSFKIAAELGDRYLGALRASRTSVSRNVTENILTRHMLPLFKAFARGAERS
jgi:hypothetical protein